MVSFGQLSSCWKSWRLAITKVIKVAFMVLSFKIEICNEIQTQLKLDGQI